MDRVYIVGVLNSDPNGAEQLQDWKVVALAAVEDDAVAQCVSPLHFVMSFERGQTLEGGWIDMFFPMAGDDEDSVQVELPL